MDKTTHGTRLFGDGIPWAKLTDDDVRKIRTLGRSLSQERIAAQFGVSRSNVGQILNNITWRHVT
jgi:DNA-binding GntR family transcriptional regulator